MPCALLRFTKDGLKCNHRLFDLLVYLVSGSRWVWCSGCRRVLWSWGCPWAGWRCFWIGWQQCRASFCCAAGSGGTLPGNIHKFRGSELSYESWRLDGTILYLGYGVGRGAHGLPEVPEEQIVVLLEEPVDAVCNIPGVVNQSEFLKKDPKNPL